MTDATSAYGRWSIQFEEERTRLFTVLRHVTDGGVLDEIAHVGATSIPGLTPTAPLITLAATLWPFPPDDSVMLSLTALGYTLLPHDENPTVLHFRHTSGAFQLYAWGVADDAWFDLIYTCDYLRHNVTVRQDYADDSLLLTPPPALVAAARAWHATHYGFGPLYTVIDTLRAVSAPWYVSSGWALDLFLGRVTRCHYDIDVVIARDDQLLLQQYLAEREWQFVTYRQGKGGPWPLHMRLELPRHQVHAHRQGVMIDLLFTDITHGVWRYRREPSIIQTVERMALETADGIRFLAPELVLLFKSKNTGQRARPQDEADFTNVYPHLRPEQRAWLRWALLVTEPHHPWLPLLS